MKKWVYNIVEFTGKREKYTTNICHNFSLYDYYIRFFSKKQSLLKGKNKDGKAKF
jgi:hypothetical protein